MGQGMSWIASHTPGSVHISEFKEVAYRQCAKNLKNKQRQTGTLWWMSDQQSRRGRRRGEAEWVVSHGDVFSLKLFEHCNQNLLWHQAYNSIYPRLLFFFLYLPFPLSAICPLSCWMSNIQRRLRCRLMLRSVCVCVCVELGAQQEVSICTEKETTDPWICTLIAEYSYFTLDLQ